MVPDDNKLPRGPHALSVRQGKAEGRARWLPMIQGRGGINKASIDWAKLGCCI